VVRAFVDAYNRHDVPGVLATLAPDIQYGDCDYTHEVGGILHGLQATQAWLRARFAEHDLFLQASIGAFPRLRPPGASLEAIRVNDGILPGQHVQTGGAKIFMTGDGARIRFVAMGGMGNCPFSQNP
jgi:hypothetical protein